MADEPGYYRITLSVSHPGIEYPVTTDVTIRFRQKILPKPGEIIQVKINGRVSEVKIDENGLLTIPKVRFFDDKTQEFELTRKL